MDDYGVTRRLLAEVAFTKIAKYLLFVYYFWRFLVIFGKTTPGNTVQTEHQNVGGAMMSAICCCFVSYFVTKLPIL